MKQSVTSHSQSFCTDALLCGSGKFCEICLKPSQTVKPSKHWLALRMPGLKVRSHQGLDDFQKLRWIWLKIWASHGSLINTNTENLVMALLVQSVCQTPQIAFLGLLWLMFMSHNDLFTWGGEHHCRGLTQFHQRLSILKQKQLLVGTLVPPKIKNITLW